MEILPDETLITGGWVLVNGSMIENAPLKRIRTLVDGHLKRVAVTADGWETLYRDPSDGRYWEKTYPHSAMHGGGPASLRVLEAAAAQEKYHIDTE